MQLLINFVGTGYTAVVSPSHGDAVSWSTGDHALSQRELITALGELGFHQQDIGDAFYSADPDWVDRSEA